MWSASNLNFRQVARIVDETLGDMKSKSKSRFSGNRKQRQHSDTDLHSDESVHFRVDDLDRARDWRSKTSVGNTTGSRHRTDFAKNDTVEEEKRGSFFNNQGQAAVNRELRKLRKHLSVVNDRLKMADKEKRDLLNALQRNQSNPSAPSVDALQKMLDKEKEKNVHLQSVVDEMFDAIKTGTRPQRLPKL